MVSNNNLNKIVPHIVNVSKFIGCFSIFIFITLNIYTLSIYFEHQNLIIFIPLILWLASLKFRGILKYNLSLNMSLIVSILNGYVLYLVTNNIKISMFYVENQFRILNILSALFLVGLLVSNYLNLVTVGVESSIMKPNLFNILYINTSKVHEIAMLIDNKIMKTVEKEQVSEELLRSSYTFKVNPIVAKVDNSFQKEDSSKKRVYENFDVKTTKSIMLRKLYDVVNKNSKPDNEQNKNIKTGELIIFKDIALERRNLDDTVMILNVLRDSKIKNQADENIEINMNKIMEKMLDDFTIDYVFKQEWDKEKCSNYIFQLPYKSNENFENGYQHNDLQIGTLSLIGIYRGEIDFAFRESVSSKFLEMMSESYNNTKIQTQQSDEIMQMSVEQVNSQLIPFEFNHKKLDEKIHVIDVIAIIQELNIDRGN